jgi:formamidopyrimidine-DNA glycosylase
MPELPEVETICENLRRGVDGAPTILGMEIRGGLVYWERTLASPSLVEFLARLPGQVIVDIGRRGKYFIFRLSEDYLLVHLRMSGDLLVEAQSVQPDKACRLAFLLEDHWRLSFNDTRKFGRVWLVADPNDVVGDLGPEPLDPAYRPEDLFLTLSSRRRQLKPLLMDQRFLAGLGNIYTDEALHLAKLHPLTPSHQVTEGQAERLWKSIRRVLEDGIRHNGSSIDWMYRGGGHQNYFLVYDRKGESCQTCGAQIERIVVGQRSTYYCPGCQQLGSQPEGEVHADPGG